MQILHYEHGEKYEPHYDYFHDKVNQELGGHRIATVLMYLSNVGKGGETVFPDAEVLYLSLSLHLPSPSLSMYKFILIFVIFHLLFYLLSAVQIWWACPTERAD